MDLDALDHELDSPSVPLSAWWRAIAVVDPNVSMDEFVGMSCAPMELAVCAAGCRCRTWSGLYRAGRSAVEQLGYRIDPLLGDADHQASLSSRLESALRRGRPVVWISDSEAALIRGIAAGNVTVNRIRRPWASSTEEGDSIRSIDSLEGGAIYSVGRTRGKRGTGRQVSLRVLAEWTAAALRPPTIGGCVLGGPLVPSVNGLAAYDMWKSRIESGESLVNGQRPLISTTELALWRDIRASGARFLAGLAGSRRSRSANLLRRAAESMSREADECWGLLVEMAVAGRIGKLPAETEQVDTAWRLAEDSFRLIGQAFCLGAGLTDSVAEALLESAVIGVYDLDEPGGMELNEIIYLARAGARPLRELAARRLAGSASAAARAALSQLIYDSDGRTAATAVWSLTQRPSHQTARTLAGAVLHGERMRLNLDYPFTLTLIASIAGMTAHGALEVLDSLRAELVARGPDHPALTDLNKVLGADSALAPATIPQPPQNR